MSEQKVNTRIVHKHDIATNWAKATNFVPKQGELIIYDDRYVDSSGKVSIVDTRIKYKIGDGVTTVNNLPFTDANVTNTISELIEEISSVRGIAESAIANPSNKVVTAYTANTDTVTFS